MGKTLVAKLGEEEARIVMRGVKRGQVRLIPLAPPLRFGEVLVSAVRCSAPRLFTLFRLDNVEMLNTFSTARFTDRTSKS